LTILPPHHYCHTFAQALDTYGHDVIEDDKGEKHAWWKDLIDELALRQRYHLVLSVDVILLSRGPVCLYLLPLLLLLFLSLVSCLLTSDRCPLNPAS
jgi:hypothetical protein